MPSFKNGICERCCKHVSQHDGDFHTCTPTNGWRELEQRLSAAEKEREEAKVQLQEIEQAITDPENQPSQYGTVTLAMYEKAERERDEALAYAEKLKERALRLVDNADFQLGGVLSAESAVKDIPSRAASTVKARHLASLRDAVRQAAPAALSHLRQEIIEQCAKVCDNIAVDPTDYYADTCAAAIRRLAEEAK